MSHEVETMAWANQVPWHGLGNRVDDCISTDEMVVAAGLDWEVEQHPCYIDLGGDGDHIEVGRQALVRSTDRRILTITGPDWKPLQNKDAIGFFKDYVEAGGAKLETAGSLRGGKVIWGLASLQKGFTLKGGDASKGYVLLTSPHEVGKAITIRATSVRVVCANTMALAQGDAVSYRQSHLKEFDIEAAKEMIDLAQQQVAHFALEAKALQQLKMSEFETVRALAKHFQPVEQGISEKEDEARIKGLINDPATMNSRMVEVLTSVNKAPGATPGNAWGVLNGVTHWADHVAGREADARMFRSWLGHTGRTKQTVKDDLLAMAA